MAASIANQLQMARRDPVAFDVSDARLACREPSKSKAGRFAYAPKTSPLERIAVPRRSFLSIVSSSISTRRINREVWFIDGVFLDRTRL